MTRSRNLSILVGAAAIVVLVAGLRAAAGIVGPVMLALALTIVFHPLRRKLEHRLPGWATSVVLLTCVYAVILGLTVALIISLGRLATLVSAYAAEADQLVAQLAHGLEALGVAREQAQAVVDALDATQLVGLATELLSGVLSVLSDLLFLFTLLLFLVFDSANTVRLADAARRHRPHLVAALSSFAHGTRTYLAVSAIFGLIVAVIDTVVLWAMGIPGAFVWGVLAFVTNFIPNIGFVIGLVPPAVIGLLEGGPGLALAVVVLYSLINVVIQSIIQPRYVGNAVGLSTTLTFLSLVFWAWVLGPLGALLAVPMSLFFRAILVEADPDAHWMEPMLSGRPGDEPGDVPRRSLRGRRRATLDVTNPGA